MKTTLFPLFVTCYLMISCNCNHETKSSIIGTWEPVKIKWDFLDSTVIEYPGNVSQCEALWIITETDNSYAVNYMIPPDTSFTLDFSAGPYTFDGKIFKETRTFSTDTLLINQSFTWELQLNNDTIIISGPAEEEVQRLGCKVYEVWIRK